MKREILVGEKKNNLTVLDIFKEKTKTGKIRKRIKCKCDCGNVCNIYYQDFGKTKTCSDFSRHLIYTKEKHMGNKIGDKKHKLTIIEIFRKITNDKKIKICYKCKCDCGKEKVIFFPVDKSCCN
jgi:hypothetical protein